jgi:hypothetical protein
MATLGLGASWQRQGTALAVPQLPSIQSALAAEEHLSFTLYNVLLTDGFSL